MAEPPPPIGRAECAAEIRQLLAQRFGHEPDDARVACIADAAEALAQQHRLASGAALVRDAAAQPLEGPLLQALLDRATNNESYFFRDAPTMETLRSTVLPRILRARRDQKAVRVWSAGCAAGEEIYSIAILLDELLGSLDDGAIALVGTDIDARAITAAREAVYSGWSLRTTPEADRERWFDRVPGSPARWRLRPRYRRRVSFELHNLSDAGARPPSPGTFDLVLCRNVTIYLSRDARQRVTEHLLGALDRHGSWIAGPSDPIPDADAPTAEGRGRRCAVAVHAGLIEITHAEERPPAAAKPAAIACAPTRPAARQPIRRPTPRVAPAVAVAAPLDAALDAVAALADAGEIPAAAAALDRLLVGGSEDPRAYRLRATLHESTPDEDALAAKAYARALYLDPLSAETHLRLGLVLDRLGDVVGAVRALRNTLALSGRAKADVDLATLAMRRLVVLERMGRS